MYLHNVSYIRTIRMHIFSSRLCVAVTTLYWGYKYVSKNSYLELGTKKCSFMSIELKERERQPVYQLPPDRNCQVQNAFKVWISNILKRKSFFLSNSRSWITRSCVSRRDSLLKRERNEAKISKKKNSFVLKRSCQR